MKSDVSFFFLSDQGFRRSRRPRYIYPCWLMPRRSIILHLKFEGCQRAYETREMWDAATDVEEYCKCDVEERDA